MIFKTHILKIAPEYFVDVVKGTKTFEVRKNDRDFKENDRIILNEYENGHYTGAYCTAIITYILNNKDYCKEGYVILGIKVI